jgi:hypothetical protein
MLVNILHDHCSISSLDHHYYRITTEKGYKLQGLVQSKRQKLITRRIRLKENKEAYQIRPDFVMPYMSERVELAEKALYLKSKGVS